MRVCKIIDEYKGTDPFGYLFYFEHGKTFSIELSDDLAASEAPLFFEAFINKGMLTVDPVWSERWVESRIIPTDRQNLGAVLKENKLKEYDPFRLLMLGSGRCAQDDCAVRRADSSELPDWVKARRMKKLDYSITLEGGSILSMFRDGSIWKSDPAGDAIADERIRMILSAPGLAEQMEMIPGGLGVRWQKDVILTAEQLYGRGERVPFSKSQFDRLLKYYVLSTSEVCDRLGCSRQYVDKKVKDGSLNVVKDGGGTRLYTAVDVGRSVE